jgi:predicted permease
LLGILGASPALGRLITADDDRPGGPAVGLLSHDFWMQRYGGDRSVIGRSVDVDGAAVEIVGVLAPGIELPDLPVALWMRSGLDPAALPRNIHYLKAIARLRPGVSPDDARVELESLIQRFPAELPSAYSTEFFVNTGFTPEVVRLRDAVVGGIARVLWILLASVGLVLLIACANVANLFLVRAEARRREIAIRSALGAERSHLAWHFLTESLLVSALGGALAIVIAYGALQTLVAVAPLGIPRLSGVALEWRSVAFTALVALGAGIVFGLFPLGRQALSLSVLRGVGRGLSVSRSQHRVRSVLVTGQVALALVLLAAAGLMLQSVRHLRSVDPGFDPRGVLAMDISLPSRYGTDADVLNFYQDFARRIGELPGVTHAGASTMLALRGTEGCSAAFVEDRAPGKWGVGCIPSRIVAPGYFEALGVAVRGTTPTWRETEQLVAGVVVTQALAQRLWPGEDALGKGIKLNGGEPPFYRVVGVSADMREEGLDKPVTEAVFYPLQPIPGWPPPRNMTVVVRTRTTEAEAVTAAIRQTLLEIDPGVPLENVATMERVVAGSIARRSFTMLLLVVAASMALLLSVVGIFGVISYVVTQRRPEIGVRMALGARASQVSRLIVGQALRLALIGIVIGLGAALATTRVLQTLLFEVGPTDPIVLGGVSAILLVFAALASYAPARRSARVDPAEVLRAE